MSTTESTPESIKTMTLVSSIIEHPEGIPMPTAVGLIGANAIVIQPVGRDHDGDGSFKLHADVHLGNIQDHVAASLLRDIASQLDGTNGEAVSND